MSSIQTFYNCTPPEYTCDDYKFQQKADINYGELAVKHIYINTDKECYLSFIVPGVKITDVKLTLDIDLLTVSVKSLSPFIIDYCEEFLLVKNLK